eukprot:2099084-Rhodomonas_salina.5
MSVPDSTVGRSQCTLCQYRTASSRRVADSGLHPRPPRLVLQCHPTEPGRTIPYVSTIKRLAHT